MDLFSLVTPGLEKIAQQEVQELLDIKAQMSHSVVEFSLKNKEELMHYLYHAQAARRIIISLGKCKDTTAITFDKKFPWTDFFSSELSFKVEVENISGQENRFALAQEVAGKLFAILRLSGIEPTINLKKPNLLVIVFYNGTDYFMGLDVAGKELNSRSYRLFLHPASCKGDVAYYFVRKSLFSSGEKLLVGLVKDGTIAIEAALFAQQLPVQKKSMLAPFPCFKDLNYEHYIAPILSAGVAAFDEHSPNLTAARKNAQLAGVKKHIELQQFFMEELSVQYPENEFDRVIMLLTLTQEDKLNEIMYQVKYILKPQGTLLLIGGDYFEISPSAPFELLEHSMLRKGNQVYRLWLLGKNDVGHK